jgi:DNA (cytosine-5)-methyltransferase 1
MKFIDLFAGIGGFRLGFEKMGFECVYSSEIDTHACEVYEENFGVNPYNDITKIDPKTIPDFDILLAGFPCQTFSISGEQKGFYDTRGTLFFDICRILEEKKPRAFVLENVQNLEKHDKGRTLTVMIHSLNDLGYVVNYKVLNAKDFGVPQNRERIVIVGNKEGYSFDFEKIETQQVKSMYPFLDKEGEFEFLNEDEYTLIDKEHIKRQQRSGLMFVGYRNKKIRTVGVRPGTEYLSRVHKQPNRIYSSDGIHPTIASQEQSGRYWILVDNKVRKLTLNECFRFMGFPEDYKKVGIPSKLYERIGNSICVKMVQAVAKEVKNQIFERSEDMTVEPMQFLEKIYKESTEMKDIRNSNLSKQQLDWITKIVEYEETLKGVYTVLFTSLTYKCLFPQQDVRLHQANMENGYSGRSFDTKFVTPFLKSKRFDGAMKESGWLTRSLEQNIPYYLDFPGKISNKMVKSAFLSILDDIENNSTEPINYLKALIKGSVVEKSKKMVVLINPIVTETKLSISDIMLYLHRHFYYKYKSRGASILPVIALYSIYECIVEELKRFDGKILDDLASHTSCDRSSGNTGDVVVRDADGSLYEVVEVKFDIPPDSIMIEDAYKKFSNTQIQRYYVLSTESPQDDEYESIQEVITKIRDEHGCQVVVNGVFPTIKYYLRLLENSDKFIEKYLHNLSINSEINYEHKLAWNIISGNDK